MTDTEQKTENSRSDSPDHTSKAPLSAPPIKRLTPEAQRALAEAAERRRLKDAQDGKPAKEIGGRDGADPTRYGDWEKGGIAWDF